MGIGTYRPFQTVESLGLHSEAVENEEKEIQKRLISEKGSPNYLTGMMIIKFDLDKEYPYFV